MTRPGLFPMLLLALLAAGCQRDTPAVAATAGMPAPSAPPAPSTVQAPAGPDAAGGFDPDLMRVTLYGERLLIEDSGHSWPVFLDTSTRDFVMRGMAQFGVPRASNGPSDCPAGKLEFLDYPNGLQLAFQDGTLVGYWAHDGARGVATEAGIHPGSQRAALGDTPIEEASFGALADLAGVIAVLDDDHARVTDLYAGAACIYD